MGETRLKKIKPSDQGKSCENPPQSVNCKTIPAVNTVKTNQEAVTNAKKNGMKNSLPTKK